MQYVSELSQTPISDSINTRISNIDEIALQDYNERMNTHIKTTNITLTDAISAYVNKRLEKI
ncbi:MAG: hypothetical protein RL536_564, partial [Candidatus Parcubacteria bacterium]